ncbi:MAG: hypothetical protein ACR2PL_19820, partial [Dehalococcoidia bacterium]
MMLRIGILEKVAWFLLAYVVGLTVASVFLFSGFAPSRAAKIGVTVGVVVLLGRLFSLPQTLL